MGKGNPYLRKRATSPKDLNMRKRFLGMAALAATLTVLVLTACPTPTDTNPDTGPKYPVRYKVVPAWTNKADYTIEVKSNVSSAGRAVTGGGPSGYLPVLYVSNDGNYNDYVIYLGRIDNVPIHSSQSAVYYDGRTPMTVSNSAITMTSDTVGNSVSKAVTETTTKTTVQERNTKINAGFEVVGIKFGVETSLNTTTTNSTTIGLSTTDTWSTAQTQSSGFTNTVSFTVGNNGEPAGRYRFTLFATTDVYLYVRMNAENTEMLADPEIAVCAREESYTFHIDYDPNTSGDFGRTGSGEMLPVPDDFSALLALTGRSPRFVAVGDSGSMALSSDGVTWAAINAVGTANWNDVAYGNGRFVAVSNAGTASPYYNMAYSSDGISWTQISINSGSNYITWNGVTYGNGRWVAVGSCPSGYNSVGMAAVSSNGSTWTTYTLGSAISGNSNSWYGITYDNIRFVAVGSSGKMAYSLNNGSTWNEITGNYGNWSGVAYGNGKFAAVSDSGRIAYSSDGLSWTQIETLTGPWYSVRYGNGMFMAIGPAVDNYSGMAYSTGGENWTEIARTPLYLKDAAYGAGKWAAAGSSGRMAYSDNAVDGDSWSEITAGTENWNGITFGVYYE